ncbi:MAG: IPExxxVDY family protein [Bacteroidetes bacterium]|nr:IPExxxVDY family protein [Bacteroidota bacterium]
MKRYTLDTPGEEVFDFDIIGISCPESHYKVIYEINTLLSIDLSLETYLEYTHKEGNEFLFPLYQFIDEALCVEYNLIPNLTSYQPPRLRNKQVSQDLFMGEVEESARLLPELDNTDYFFMLKGQNRYMYYHAVYEQMRKSRVFTAIQEIYVEDIRDKKARGNLLF